MEHPAEPKKAAESAATEDRLVPSPASLGELERPADVAGGALLYPLRKAAELALDHAPAWLALALVPVLLQLLGAVVLSLGGEGLPFLRHKALDTFLVFGLVAVAGLAAGATRDRFEGRDVRLLEVLRRWGLPSLEFCGALLVHMLLMSRLPLPPGLPSLALLLLGGIFLGEALFLDGQHLPRALATGYGRMLGALLPSRWGATGRRLARLFPSLLAFLAVSATALFAYVVHALGWKLLGPGDWAASLSTMAVLAGAGFGVVATSLVATTGLVADRAAEAGEHELSGPDTPPVLPG